MRISDHLTKEQKSQLNKIKSPMKKKEENFSRRDIEDLMGSNRDTYRRGKGGAIRRR